jgi:dTDP-4-dehydrorhamnose 3,5-epimerase
MDFIDDLTAIDGVQMTRLQTFSDDRGQFNEIFRRSWFPQVSWDKLQSNLSRSQAGVLRGLHYHFHQVDYWFVPHGRIRAGLVDLRPSSPTYQTAQIVEMGGDNHIGLFIPVGVAHGFYAVTDCTLIYYVNNYYTGSDEYGVAWDDPAFSLDWGNSSAPLVSDRDANNPRFEDITPEAMPE